MYPVATASAPVSVRLARDPDPVVAALPGIDLGDAELTGPPTLAASRLYREGVARVTLHAPVDLTGAGGTARPLLLVRDLTSYAIAVGWSANLPSAASWRAFGHLFPPVALTLAGAAGPEADAVHEEWRRTYYFTKCVYRRGPGFVQVRDRRLGELSLITIDDPAYLAVLEQLLDDETPDNPDIVAAFAEEGLVTEVGGQLVWLPYRVRRWPLPSTIV